MTILPGPGDVLVLDPAVVGPVPWVNGAGSTRQLLVSDSLRISVADLTVDAPFSTFAGFDRLFVLLSGAIVLGGRDLNPGTQVRFPGEREVAVTVTEAGRALNVMTLRGRVQATVSLTTTAPIDADVAVALDDGQVAAIHLTHEGTP